MQTVTQAWIDNQQQTIVSEAFVEITHNTGNVDAQKIAVPSVVAGGETAYSDVSTVKTQGNTARWASMELNAWDLGGNSVVIPDIVPDTIEEGYVSTQISGSDCTYSTSPAVRLSFSPRVTTSSTAVTIVFSSAYRECADSFTVATAGGNPQSTSVTGNRSVKVSVPLTLSNYDSITVTVSKWMLPNRRCRIEQILIGEQIVYGKSSSLVSSEHSMSADLISANIYEQRLSFKIDNSDNILKINRLGESTFLQSGQEVSIRYGYNLGGSIEWISGGTYFLDNWQIPQNGFIATINAVGLSGLLNIPYTGRASGSYGAVCEDAMASLPLRNGSPRYVIPTSMYNISVSGVDLTQFTCAEIVQYAANASRFSVSQSRYGNVVFSSTTTTPTVNATYTISDDNSYEKSEYDLSKSISCVVVNNSWQYPSTPGNGEIQYLDNPLIINPVVGAAVAQWAYGILSCRRTAYGDMRIDPRVDVLDCVTLQKNGDIPLYVTDVNIKYNGAINGSYKGRWMEQ